MQGHFQSTDAVSQLSIGYTDELKQNKSHLIKKTPTHSYILSTVYVNGEAINNLYQKKSTATKNSLVLF